MQAIIDELNEQEESDAKAYYLPTPEQIREACRAIQGEWSERERARRAGIRAPVPLEVTRGTAFWDDPRQHGD